MEVDAASDDSDATVADEEDPPTAAVIPQLTESQATQNWTGHSGRRPGSVPSQAAAAPPRCSGSTGAVNGRADDGEDAGPSSPSLLQGGSTLVNRLESQSTKLGYVIILIITTCFSMLHAEKSGGGGGLVNYVM